MLQSGLCQVWVESVWVTLQSGLCYSLGYVTVWVMLQSGLCRVWVKDSLGNGTVLVMLQSGLCYSLGYVTVWVKSSLG